MDHDLPVAVVIIRTMSTDQEVVVFIPGWVAGNPLEVRTGTRLW